MNFSKEGGGGIINNNNKKKNKRENPSHLTMDKRAPSSICSGYFTSSCLLFIKSSTPSHQHVSNPCPTFDYLLLLFFYYFVIQKNFIYFFFPSLHLIVIEIDRPETGTNLPFLNFKIKKKLVFPFSRKIKEKMYASSQIDCWQCQTEKKGGGCRCRVPNGMREKTRSPQKKTGEKSRVQIE
jgi:hypothetical protein